MPEKRGRPSTERSRAAASKERALAHLRWLQVREKRKELKRTIDVEATIARMLAMIRDRMLGLPDGVPELSESQREVLRREISQTLTACSNADL
jgi:hypothetical protein